VTTLTCVVETTFAPPFLRRNESNGVIHRIR
jgi:hypothetical protein